MLPAAAWTQSDVQRIKADYSLARAQLEKHLVADQWIDDDPRSPELLAKTWSLAGEWVAAWLDAHPLSGAEGIRSALVELAPSDTPDCLELNPTTFLVAAPGPIGNVFIVTKSNDRYRLAWSTGQPQNVSGKAGRRLAAWLAENARTGGRGPYWAASGSAGPVRPVLGRLPNDARGNARFYIEGVYAQAAGGTVGAQISLWIWNGTEARFLISKSYAIMIGQPVRARVEGTLLKVQQKKSFRSFFSCGMCIERQTDWIVRLDPEGVTDLGETAVAPELDAIDQLFYRVINGRPAASLATPAAIQTAERIVREARAVVSEKDWKEFPSLGMAQWNIVKRRNEEVVCLATDYAGSNLFHLKPSGENPFFIAKIEKAKRTCEK
jgi:hypothetical protein